MQDRHDPAPEPSSPRIAGGRRPGDTWSLLGLVFHAGFGALLALYVAFFVIKCAADIRCPYTLDYGEGLVLNEAVRLAQGETLYNDYNHYPFVVSNYPPVFILLGALGVKLFGISFAFGRSLSFAFMLAVGIMMVVLLRRCGIRLAPALGAPALLLSTTFVTMWSGFMRVDSLALLWVMAGLYFVLRGGKWLVVATLMMVAASYTKQSMVAGLAAAAVYLWWTGRRREAALFVVSWAAIGIAIFALLQVTSHGWFYHHMVTANANPWDLLRALTFIGIVVTDWPATVALAVGTAAFLVVSVWRTRTRHGRPGISGGEQLFLPYFAFAAVSSLTSGKAGATVNYMIEPLAAALLLGAFGYQRLIDELSSRAKRMAWVLIALAFVGQAIMMWRPPSRWDPGREYAAEGGRAAAALFARTKGDIIGEPVGNIVLSGRTLLLDPASFSQMSLAGVWDPTPLLRDIRRQRFVLVFTGFNPATGPDRFGSFGQGRWSGRIMQSILIRYRVTEVAGTTFFLTPIPGKRARDPGGAAALAPEGAGGLTAHAKITEVAGAGCAPQQRAGRMSDD
ncbi:MAG: hypothetical protein JSV65_05475 [Armatimonadota bacterium]|nr:MAG: hypothetical protein JSV65_05475 [Armatimonadota bacterium]